MPYRMVVRPFARFHGLDGADVRLRKSYGVTRCRVLSRVSTGMTVRTTAFAKSYGVTRCRALSRVSTGMTVRTSAFAKATA